MILLYINSVGGAIDPGGATVINSLAAFCFVMRRMLGLRQSASPSVFSPSLCMLYPLLVFLRTGWLGS